MQLGVNSPDRTSKGALVSGQVIDLQRFVKSWTITKWTTSFQSMNGLSNSAAVVQLLNCCIFARSLELAEYQIGCHHIWWFQILYTPQAYKFSFFIKFYYIQVSQSVGFCDFNWNHWGRIRISDPKIPVIILFPHSDSNFLFWILSQIRILFFGLT